jgi:hypothetical protein
MSVTRAEWWDADRFSPAAVAPPGRRTPLLGDTNHFFPAPRPHRAAERHCGELGLLGSVVVGLGLPWTLIAAVTAVQTETPGHLLGRVAATSNMVMFGPIALAIPVGAAVVELGARPPLLAVASLALLAGALALRAEKRKAWAT